MLTAGASQLHQMKFLNQPYNLIKYTPCKGTWQGIKSLYLSGRVIKMAAVFHENAGLTVQAGAELLEGVPGNIIGQIIDVDLDPAVAAVTEAML